MYGFRNWWFLINGEMRRQIAWWSLHPCNNTKTKLARMERPSHTWPSPFRWAVYQFNPHPQVQKLHGRILAPSERKLEVSE